MNPPTSLSLVASAAVLLAGLFCAPRLEAAPPPFVSVVYTNTGPVHGGVSLGPDGTVYWSVLSSGIQSARVVALNANNTLRWQWLAPTAGAIIGYGIRNGVAKSWILYPQCQD